MRCTPHPQSLPVKGREAQGRGAGVHRLPPPCGEGSRVGGGMSRDLARKLRRQFSPPEQAFWRITHPLRQAGWNFRRQHFIGAYYVDFACLHAGLIVEIDGDSHCSDLAQTNDATRDDYLRGRGFTVMRFGNRDVLHNPDGVYAVLCLYLDTLPACPPPQPSPQGGGSRIETGAQPKLGHRPNSLPLAGRVGVGGSTRSTSDEDHQ